MKEKGKEEEEEATCCTVLTNLVSIFFIFKAKGFRLARLTRHSLNSRTHSNLQHCLLDSFCRYYYFLQSALIYPAIKRHNIFARNNTC